MYEYMILMMPKKNQTRLLQRLSIASRLTQGCFNKTKACFKINSRSSLASKTKCFQDIQGSGNRLPGSVIDYQKTSLKNSYLKGF